MTANPPVITLQSVIDSIRAHESQHGPVKRITSASIWTIQVRWTDGYNDSYIAPDDSRGDTAEHNNRKMIEAFLYASIRLFNPTGPNHKHEPK